MSEIINDLKRCVKQYRDIDNEIRELNKEVYSKREDRKAVEMELTDLVKLPQFSGIDKLKIDDDGSTIKIARPGTYAKAWALSQKELEGLLHKYFGATVTPNPSDCVQYIVSERKKGLVNKDFDFSRVIPEE